MSPTSHYPTASPGAQPSLGVSGVVSRAVDAVRADPLIVAVMFLTILFGALINSVIPIIGNLFTVLGTGIAIVMATKTLDEDNRPEKSFDVRIISLVGATLVGTILVAIGLLLLILPGIYLTVRFALFPAAVMVDDTGPIDAFIWSWVRTGGHSLTVFGFILVVTVPVILLMAVPVVIFSFQILPQNPLLYSLMAGVIGAPFAALNAGGVAVMYAAFKE